MKNIARLRPGGATSRLAVLILAAAVCHADSRADSAPARDIPATASAAGSFQTLVKALKAADLVGALQEEGPFTVFAPTDDAFAALPEGALAGLLRDKEALRAVLLRHVVAGRITAKGALLAGEARTLSEASIEIDLVDGRLQVDGANVVATDIAASNGVIHVLDRVLLPPATAPDNAAGLLRLAVDRGVPLFNAGQRTSCAAVYEVAACGALLAPDLADDARKLLEDALARARREPDAGASAWILRRAFDRVLADADKNVRAERAGGDDGFRLVVEAELPAGFPEPGPLGEVVVKEYPRYRAARAEGANPFWKLFRHIKTNDIAMTAPVEMTLEADDGKMRQTDMAFLYGKPDQGEAGAAGPVEVVDNASLRVLSVGLRGPLTDAKLARARRQVENTLSKSGFERAGAWRLMGYNSPMVPAGKRFYELQLPVAEVSARR